MRTFVLTNNIDLNKDTCEFPFKSYLSIKVVISNSVLQILTSILEVRYSRLQTELLLSIRLATICLLAISYEP